MDIKDIDVVCPQLLQAVSDGDMHALRRISCKVGLKRLLLAVVCTISGSVLCGNDHLISVSSLLHPFPNQALGVLGIVCVGRVNKVAT